MVSAVYAASELVLVALDLDLNWFREISHMNYISSGIPVWNWFVLVADWCGRF